MLDAKYLLTDEQMREFITKGYLVLQTDLSQEFHEKVFQKLEEVYATEGNPGNNVIPRIPELEKVYKHPVIQGALTSVLGPDYLFHPHRHCHFNEPNPNRNPGGVGWHKDSYWGYYKMRNHHPWWAMIFYYNQDVTLDLGPSSAEPGTQWYDKLNFDVEKLGNRVLGKAGTFALIHYDLWHRATFNVSNINRYMLKMQFVRMSAPTYPSWNNQDPTWQAPQDVRDVNSHQVIWEHMWNWLSGRQNERISQQYNGSKLMELIDKLEQMDSDQLQERTKLVDEIGKIGIDATDGQVTSRAIATLQKALEEEAEPGSLNAAYSLSQMGVEGIEALVQVIRETERKRSSKHAAYALAAAGDTAVELLKQLLDVEESHKRGDVAFALGELGAAASSTVAKLISLLEDESEWVRRNVTEALGTIGQPIDEVVSGLIKALKDEDTQVRFTAGLSLARIGTEAAAAIPALVEVLEDENRYVRANAVDALKRIGTEEAKDALLNYLLVSRWCPSTTTASTF